MEEGQKESDLLLRHGMKCFSQQMKLHIHFIENDVSTTSFLPLYRKENSELETYCRHNVYLSHLFISRQKKIVSHLFSSPCKGILTLFLFTRLEKIY